MKNILICLGKMLKRVYQNNGYDIQEINMRINDNYDEILMGLWFDVLVKDKIKNILIHCICPYTDCKSYKDAIDYYYNRHNKEEYDPILVQHHGYTKEGLENLSMFA